MFGLVANSYAGLVSVDAIVSQDDMTVTWHNDMVTTFSNALNSIDGTLIRSRTISSDSLTRNADPVLRWNDTFNSFVITGLLPPTSASLTSTTTSGRAIIDGYYVEKDATAHTYTASKDTYLDLSKTGVYTYTAVANGAAEPATTADSIRLAKVVTDGTTVSSVVDLRTTSVELANKDDHYLFGMNVIAVSPDCYVAGLITIDAGVCYVGTTRIEKTVSTTLDTGTANDWHDGMADAGADTWWWIGVDTDGNIKLLGANPPDVSDTDGNTAGDKLYWYDSVNEKYWRVIGVFKTNSSSIVSWDFWQDGRTIWYRIPHPFALGTSTTWAEADISNLVPPFSEAVNVMVSNNNAGDFVSIRSNMNQESSGSAQTKRHLVDIVEANRNTAMSVGWIFVSSDSNSPGIDYRTDGGNTAVGWMEAYTLKFR